MIEHRQYDEKKGNTIQCRWVELKELGKAIWKHYLSFQKIYVKFSQTYTTQRNKALFRRQDIKQTKKKQCQVVNRMSPRDT